MKEQKKKIIIWKVCVDKTSLKCKGVLNLKCFFSFSVASRPSEPSRPGFHWVPLGSLATSPSCHLQPTVCPSINLSVRPSHLDHFHPGEKNSLVQTFPEFLLKNGDVWQSGGFLIYSYLFLYNIGRLIIIIITIINKNKKKNTWLRQTLPPPTYTFYRLTPTGTTNGGTC